MTYQTYLQDCECFKKGMSGLLLKDNIPYCRWCRTPYGKGGGIIYDEVDFKKPLFTTEDGKEIFEGDEWWMVREEGAHTNEWEIVPFYCNYAINGGKKPNRCKAAFSTEEKAKEYVMNNKPVLSFLDILDWVIPILIQVTDRVLRSERLNELDKLVKKRIWPIQQS